jgi:hypothetical protein
MAPNGLVLLFAAGPPQGKKRLLGGSKPKARRVGLFLGAVFDGAQRIRG